MIKIENMHIDNIIVRAVYAARNAMNSWEKSDSDWTTDTLGEADLTLAKKLAKAGSVHAKYRRMINVTVDITAPLYWWKEFDTYKVGTVANSCSTMHKIHAKEFTVYDFSFERTLPICSWFITSVLNVLNTAREKYLETGEKVHWDTMIQFLPSSYNQKRTIQMNYEVLVGMYRDRKNHKLKEWQVLCEWIEQLPYSELITGND